MSEEEQDREGLTKQLRSEARRLRELPADTPYQLVVSSVDAVVLGSLLNTAADEIENLANQVQFLKAARTAKEPEQERERL